MKSPGWRNSHANWSVIRSWLDVPDLDGRRRRSGNHGSTSLSWERPTVAENDTPIDNIAGYTIHCWGEGGHPEHTIEIDDPSVNHFEIDGLPPGRYQCAVSAYTEDGFESDLSNFVARTVE